MDSSGGAYLRDITCRAGYQPDPWGAINRHILHPRNDYKAVTTARVLCITLGIGLI